MKIKVQLSVEIDVEEFDTMKELKKKFEKAAKVRMDYGSDPQFVFNSK